MNNQLVQANPIELDNAAGKIINAAEDIGSAFNVIKSYMENMEDIWRDENAKKFKEKFEELSLHFPTFKNAAVAMGESMRFAGKTYQAANEKISQSING